MKSFLCSLLFVFVAAVAGAQQLHFVYLQTDSRKPFYVLLNNKNYSSSSIGYVILPKLQNGDYTVRIGFPRNEQPEQEFLLQVKNNDQGFLVKDFGDKGWGLFNLQSLDIQYAGSLTEKRNQQLAQQKAAEEKQQQEANALAATENQRRADSVQAAVQAQNKALADAEAAQAALRQQRYNDSVQQATAAANQQTQAQAAERRRLDSLQKTTETNTTAATQKAADEAEQRRITDSLQQVANAAAANMQQQREAAQQRSADSLTKAQAAVLQNERLERLADSTAKAQAAAIEKAKQNAAGAVQVSGPVLLQKTFTDTGWRYQYSVNGGNGKETVDVFIPVHQSQPVVVATPVVKMLDVQPTNPPVQQPTTVTTPPDTKQQTTTTPPYAKKEDTQFLNIEFGSNTVVKTDTANPGVKVLHNSNCRAAADEKDFLMARKKMVAANDTEKMVAVARKLMKEKCFTTEQVRNLSFLFLTDADRYQFLDAAYPFALDAYRFNSLQDLLKDDYYVQRFKAMLR